MHNNFLILKKNKFKQRSLNNFGIFLQLLLKFRIKFQYLRSLLYLKLFRYLQVISLYKSFPKKIFLISTGRTNLLCMTITFRMGIFSIYFLLAHY